jgi:hypothetical protein
MKLHHAVHIALSLGAIIAMLVIAGNAMAQYVVSTKAGIIQYIDGSVFLDDKPQTLSNNSNLQIGDGQSLSTKQGHVEVLFNTCVYLRLGENGRLRMEQYRPRDIQLRLQQGSAMIEIVEEIIGNRIAVRLSSGVAEIQKAGLYRFDADASEARVYGGELAAVNGNNKTKVKNGRKIRLGQDHRSKPFNVNETDALHRWAALRSFTLFQGNWQVYSTGWARNPNYRLSFYSDALLMDPRVIADLEAERIIAAQQSAAQRSARKSEAQAAAAARAAIQQQQQQQMQQQRPPTQQPGN